MHKNYYENIVVGDLFVLKANKHFMLVTKVQKNSENSEIQDISYVSFARGGVRVWTIRQISRYSFVDPNLWTIINSLRTV